MARAGVLATTVGVLLLLGGGAWWVAGVLMRPATSAEPPVGIDEGSGDDSGTPGAAGVLSPDALGEMLQAAQDAVVSGDGARARRVLAQGVSEYPDDQDLRAAFGELLLGLGDAGAAYEQYAAALAVGKPTGALQFGAGLAASVSGDPQRAAAHFDAAQQLEPSVAAYAIYLATSRRAIGDLEGASAALVRATVLAPDNADAWGLLSEVALQQNRAVLAQQHAERARTLEPGEPAWRVLEARALKRGGDAEGALLVLRGIEGEALYGASVLRTMGECLGLLGRQDEAAELYLEAVLVRGDDAEVLFDAAVWQERVGQAANATRLAERSAELGHAPARRWLDERDG